MKRNVLICLMVLLTCTSLMAQQTTTAVTVYREFKPAKVLLASGKSTKVALANIFLKNSTLLYKHGTETMQAKTSTIQRVEFDDRTYYRIDSLLAYQVDTIGSDALFRTERIDFEAFNQERINNVEITSLSLGEVMQYTTHEIDSEQNIHFPLESLFYFRIGGKYILAQERSVARALNKEKRRMMKSAMLDPAFSWTSEQSLMKMLEMIR